ncbi:MAG TPA: hypothetical protein VG941_00535 [Candidatus Paceibacterota bacterium]|nr:hypothetical protein [Candidatus Paceibacterota bacterium]
MTIMSTASNFKPLDFSGEFLKLNPDIQRAIIRLHVVRERALSGVGGQHPHDNIIARGYSIVAPLVWRGLTTANAHRLASHGWAPSTYNIFMLWCHQDRVRAQGVLRWCLEQEKLPRFSDDWPLGH